MTADVNLWADAACAGRSHLFEEADAGERWATAACLRLCGACPIQAFCLEATLRYERTPGAGIELICGGMLPAQRAALLGKRYRNHHQKVTT